MKSRKALLSIIFVLVLFTVPFVAAAQQPGRFPTIGYLSPFSGPASPPSSDIKAILEGLRDLGYAEGKNIAIEYRFAEGKNDRLPGLAAELVRLKVDIIVTPTGMAAVQAKKTTQTIPIVATMADPVSQGLVASLANPGGNVTGLTSNSSAISGRRLQLLKEAIPKLTHVGALWPGGGNPVMDREWKETEAAAHPLNLQLTSLKTGSLADFPAAFAEGVRQHIQAVLMFDVPPWTIPTAASRIAELALQNRLPMMSNFPRLTQQGGLMSYGANLLDLNRRAATYVDRILKGARPADLPVGEPTKFMLWINLKTGKALGLTIPQSLLSQADQRIE